MTPEQAVIDRLSAESAVSAIVGTRLWMLKLPQKPALPAIRVQLIDDPQTKHLRGPSGSTAARVQVDCYESEGAASDPYVTVSVLADAVNAALVNEPFDAAGSPVTLRVTNVERTDRRALYEADELRLVRMFQDFIVWSRVVM